MRIVFLMTYFLWDFIKAIAVDERMKEVTD